jgi:ubiquinone/menaquinone biosynthesis C-methylase UbiE
MDYNKDTRDAYRNELKAKEYQEQYTKGTKWARFTMWRQRVLIDKIINQCNFKKTDKILDIPCGTGFIGKILSKTPASNGFVECDITKTPFRKESFDCIILLAFMHRLPKEIRAKTWENVVELSKKFIIVNYSIDSRSQRLKQWLIKKVRPNHIPAPSSLSLQEIINEIESFDLVIRKSLHVAYFFSGKIIFLLEKRV